MARPAHKDGLAQAVQVLSTRRRRCSLVTTVLDGIRTRAYQAIKVEGQWYVEGPNVSDPAPSRKAALMWASNCNLAYLTGAAYLAQAVASGIVEPPQPRKET